MTPAETLRAAAARLDADAADLARTWKAQIGEPTSRVARRVAIDMALAIHLRVIADDIDHAQAEDPSSEVTSVTDLAVARAILGEPA